MITRLRWYDAPIDAERLRSVSRAMSQHSYRAGESWGFQLKEKRREQIAGAYVERTERIERAVDPFGGVSEFPVVEFRTVDFSLSTSYPGLEVRNPPRSLGTFLKHLDEFSGRSMTIVEPRCDVASWVISIERRTSGIVTAIHVQGVTLSADSSASIRVEGTKDVRGPTERLIAKRTHMVTAALLSWRMSNEEVTADIRGPGRVIVTATRSPAAIDLLRESLVEAAAVRTR